MARVLQSFVKRRRTRLGIASGERVMEKRNNGKRIRFGETIHNLLTDEHQGYSGAWGCPPKKAQPSTLAAVCNSSLESHDATPNAPLTRDLLRLQLLIPP